MENATSGAASQPTRVQATQFDPLTQLTSKMPSDGHLIFADYRSSVSSMVGAIRVSKTRAPNAWERHDHGDELLVLLAGAFTVTLRDPDGRSTERQMSKGEVLLIPSGVAHHATLHTDEVQVLFVTPRTGTEEWSEGSKETWQ